jgi:Fe-S-cluster containining protein
MANDFTRKADITYRRDSPFSYECHACSRCCYDKVIQLNPYEVARLARNRGIGTTEFLARFTERSGTALRRTEEGACVFLTPQGCGVHPDRPLVCRLYPLGRRVTANGEETFREVKPHPQTEGVYGENGTVQDFLDRQGVQPFIEAVDRYVEVVVRMSAALTQSEAEDRQLKQDVEEAVGQLLQGNNEDTPKWIDMDLVVSRFCATPGVSIPSDVSVKMAVHLRALEEWIGSLSSSTAGEGV